jgi:hypothetical protein
MKRLSRSLIAGFALIGLCLSGCFVVQSSTISSSAAKGKAVTASAQDWGILHLTVPEGLTANVNSQLISQCPSAKLSNVSTHLDTREFFLAQLYTVTANAQCNP